jgi:uncharacterized repeat protein (TIGR01451 family)
LLKLPKNEAIKKMIDHLKSKPATMQREQASSFFKTFAACLLSGAAVMPMSAQAHGVGFTNARVQMDPASIAAQMSKPVPGITSADSVSYIIQADTASSSGATGYFTLYPQVGATVTNAEFVSNTFAKINASPPAGMPDGYGPRGVRTFTNWTATTGHSSLSILHGDTGIFYSTNPITQLFNPNADGSITTSILGATIRTTSQLMGVTATHNMWDANQTRAFGAGTANAAANTTSTAPVVNTVGTGTTPYRAGSPVAGSDIAYSLDNTGVTGPWSRISYPNSYGTLGLTIAPATVAGAVAISGSPTLAGAGFPLPASANAIRWIIGGPVVPATYYARVALQFSPAILSSPNGIILTGEASGSDARGDNNGQDNSWRYHQPATFAGATAVSDLRIVKDIIAVNGVPSLNPASVPAGSKLTYRIRYLNAGTLPQTSVVLSDTVPAQISTVCANISNVAGSATAASNTCPAASTTITFNVPVRLNPGQGGAVTFDVQLAGSVGNTVTNSTRLATAQNAVGATANIATVLTLPPSLTVTKTATPSSFIAGATGQVYTVTIAVANGPTSAPITLNDTLPTDITTVAANITATGGVLSGCSSTTSLAGCTIAAGAANGNIVITVPVSVAATAINPSINTATVTGGGDPACPAGVNCRGTVTTPITLAASVVISKTDGKSVTTSGGTNDYIVTLSNQGPSPANGVVVTDAFGGGLTCPAANAVTCSGAVNGAVCPAGPLTIANLTGAGIAVATLPVSGALQFAYTCNVN